MKVLTFTVTAAGADIVDALAAVPGLEPVDGPNGKTAVFTVHTDRDTVTVTAPDDADEAAIAAALQTYTPAPPPPAAPAADHLAALDPATVTAADLLNALKAAQHTPL